MAVVHDHIGTDAIAAALDSDDMWVYQETQSLGLATPPVHEQVIAHEPLKVSLGSMGLSRFLRFS